MATLLPITILNTSGHRGTSSNTSRRLPAVGRGLSRHESNEMHSGYRKGAAGGSQHASAESTADFTIYKTLRSLDEEASVPC